MTNDVKKRPTQKVTRKPADAPTSESPHRCPNCDYCPACGRSNHPSYVCPNWYPNYVWPYRYTITCGGAIGSGTTTTSYMGPATA